VAVPKVPRLLFCLRCVYVGNKVSIMVANDKAKMTIKYMEHMNFNLDVFHFGNLGRNKLEGLLLCVRMD
jgi:hypothetical protein